MADPAAAAPAPVSAQVVGNAFVQQYYHILHHSPALVHRFYQDISKLGRPEEDGSMSITTTMKEIDAKILSLNYGDFKYEIKSVDAQESLAGGVSVLVTGYLTGTDNIQQQFAQSFFLAPQDKGYFVLNDMFRYMNSANHHEEDHAPTEVVVAPAAPEQVPEAVPVVEDNIPEQAAVLTEESQAEQADSVENAEVPVVEEDPIPEVVDEVSVVQEDPVSEVVDEVQDLSQLAAESHTKTEDVPKKSYASIVMDMKQTGVPFSNQAPPLRKPQPRKQEPPLLSTPPTTVAAEPVISNTDAVESDPYEEEVEYSVYIKGLPMDATRETLEEEFKKFGLIKPNGIQVRNNRGFAFGFVAFEAPDAVQKALEASPITINGKNAVVEEKRSAVSRIGNRGRFAGGRGPGYRYDVVRGRGNFGGGRGYNRGGGDFGGNRNDYGYRGSSRGGPSSNRGGDGYQRDNNGGRFNRGVDVSGAGRIPTQ